MTDTPTYDEAIGEWSNHKFSVRLPQNSHEHMHNHGTAEGDRAYAPWSMEYKGFSTKALYYHLWSCSAKRHGRRCPYSRIEFCVDRSGLNIGLTDNKEHPCVWCASLTQQVKTEVSAA